MVSFTICKQQTTRKNNKEMFHWIMCVGLIIVFLLLMSYSPIRSQVVFVLTLWESQSFLKLDSLVVK